jgi:hypothetical protein
MKLRYRGSFYERAPCLNCVDGEVSGKYRGIEWRSRHLQMPLVLYSVRALAYRGIPYLSGIYRFASPHSRDLSPSYKEAMS